MCSEIVLKITLKTLVEKNPNFWCIILFTFEIIYFFKISKITKKLLNELVRQKFDLENIVNV